ncbi:unnamed protein product [Albugo candida]|uniref:U1-type domain-containing protein n=1 Tax=Albugo candida TaxID=65357 RepID=A0A024GJ62_9STRA|nr:unnamed protein product [Albugo candida]|eukprot:CCI46751.1 unnamed protein product [Albugo candida]
MGRKFECVYCKKIFDDSLESRRRHDNGRKHKMNVELWFVLLIEDYYFRFYDSNWITQNVDRQMHVLRVMTGSNGSQNRDARKKTCLLQWYRQILNYLGIFTPIGDDRYASYFHLNAEYISTYFSLSHGCAAICITFNRCPGSSTTSSLLSKSLTLWEI